MNTPNPDDILDAAAGVESRAEGVAKSATESATALSRKGSHGPAKGDAKQLARCADSGDDQEENRIDDSANAAFSTSGAGGRTRDLGVMNPTL